MMDALNIFFLVCFLPVGLYQLNRPHDSLLFVFYCLHAENSSVSQKIQQNNYALFQKIQPHNYAVIPKRPAK